jgi:hypothetical protein
MLIDVIMFSALLAMAAGAAFAWARWQRLSDALIAGGMVAIAMAFAGAAIWEKCP